MLEISTHSWTKHPEAPGRNKKELNKYSTFKARKSDFAFHGSIVEFINYRFFFYLEYQNYF